MPSIRSPGKNKFYPKTGIIEAPAFACIIFHINEYLWCYFLQQITNQTTGDEHLLR